MSYEYTEPSLSDLEKAEQEAMVRPEPCYMRDERLYTTHGPVISWAERGGEEIPESNYLLVTAHLSEIAGPDDRMVIDGTFSDWAVGSLRMTFVQVRDDAGEFTRVWKEAVAIALYLRDVHPVFDDDDVSQREWESWTKFVDGEMAHVTEDWADVDGEDLHSKLCYTAIGDLQDSGAIDYYSYPDRAELQDAYRNARNTYYTDVAQLHLGAQIAGQGALSL